MTQVATELSDNDNENILGLVDDDFQILVSGGSRDDGGKAMRGTEVYNTKTKRYTTRIFDTLNFIDLFQVGKSLVRCRG